MKKPLQIKHQEKLTLIPKGFEVIHVIPRAICVAKPSHTEMIFAVPALDCPNNEKEPKKEYITVEYNETGKIHTEYASEGDWVTLLFISNPKKSLWVSAKAIKIEIY